MSDSQGCVAEWSIGHLRYLRKANGVLAQTKKPAVPAGATGRSSGHQARLGGLRCARCARTEKNHRRAGCPASTKRGLEEICPEGAWIFRSPPRNQDLAWPHEGTRTSTGTPSLRWNKDTPVGRSDGSVRHAPGRGFRPGRLEQNIPEVVFSMKGQTFRRRRLVKKILITSMLAIGVGCGAALAQEQQPAQSQSGADCPAGSAGCPEGAMGEQGKAGATTEEQAQGKAKMQTDEQAQGKAGVTTEQQTQGEAGATTEQQAQDKAKTQTEQQTQGEAGTTTEQQTQGEAGTTTEQQTQGTAQPQDKTETGAITNVTVEQKTQITQILKEEKVEPVADVDFDISVGVEVPRQKVELRPLPRRIIEIVPAYEEYQYFVLADGRIVIVDPDTFTIVLILA